MPVAVDPYYSDPGGFCWDCGEPYMRLDAGLRYAIHCARKFGRGLCEQALESQAGELVAELYRNANAHGCVPRGVIGKYAAEYAPKRVAAAAKRLRDHEVPLPDHRDDDSRDLADPHADAIHAVELGLEQLSRLTAAREWLRLDSEPFAANARAGASRSHARRVDRLGDATLRLAIYSEHHPVKFPGGVILENLPALLMIQERHDLKPNLSRRLAAAKLDAVFVVLAATDSAYARYKGLAKRPTDAQIRARGGHAADRNQFRAPRGLVRRGEARIAQALAATT